MHHVAFGGRLIMLGFGSIGQGVLPLILRHIDMPRERITIISGDERGQEVAAENGVGFHRPSADARQLPGRAGAAVASRRLPAEPERRCVVRGADRVLPAAGCAVSGHLHRAMGGRLHRSVADAVATVELCAA